MFLFGLWTIFHIWYETSRYCIGIRWTRWHRLQCILVSYASMLQGLSMIEAHLISDVCPSHMMPVEKMDIWQCRGITPNFTFLKQLPGVTPPRQDKEDLFVVLKPGTASFMGTVAICCAEEKTNEGDHETMIAEVAIRNQDALFALSSKCWRQRL